MVEFALIAPILFVFILATIEAGRFILHYELVNHATREGARYAIVHGSRSACPSGPPPPGEVNPCDPAGDNIKAAVRDAALYLVSSGGLVVHDPVWTSRGSLGNPRPGDASSGHNGRGEYVSVFVDYTYDPIIEAGLRDGHAAGCHHQRGVDPCRQQLSSAVRPSRCSPSVSRRSSSPLRSRSTVAR